MKALLIALLVSGCAVAASNKTRNAMQQSLANYKACLKTKQDCSREKAIYEADLKAYKAAKYRAPGTK